MDEESEDYVCIFEDIVHTCSRHRSDNFIELLETRLEKIKDSSLDRKDGFHDKLDDFISPQAHNYCYLHYTSKDHIQRHLKRTAKCSVDKINSSSSRKSRRSTSKPFDFNLHCIFCGEPCAIKPDPKNPSRWKKNKGILCRTADRGKGNLSFKDVILQVSI